MKKSQLIICIYTIITIFLLTSCIDIIEEDINDKKIELLSPSDSLKTKETNHRFWWNSISGALWYELQVVSPDFSNISSLKLDTTVEINNFQFSLQPGVYHWRVRALNGSSSTDYSENLLVILESP